MKCLQNLLTRKSYYKTRTVSQITKWYSRPALPIISHVKVKTDIILLQVHPHVLFYTCVKFYQYWFICLRGDVLSRHIDRRTREGGREKEDEGWRTRDGGRETEDERRTTTEGGQQMEDERWRTTEGGRQTSVVIQILIFDWSTHISSWERPL